MRHGAFDELQLTEVGTHDELLAKDDGIYRKLVDGDPWDTGHHQYYLREAVATLVTVLERMGRHAEAVDVHHRRGGLA